MHGLLFCRLCQHLAEDMAFFLTSLRVLLSKKLASPLQHFEQNHCLFYFNHYFFCVSDVYLHHFTRICIINIKNDADFSFIMQKSINFTP